MQLPRQEMLMAPIRVLADEVVKSGRTLDTFEDGAKCKVSVMKGIF